MMTQNADKKRDQIQMFCMEDLILNILATRNRESGNLEIGVPVLGNRLFCA